MLNNLWKCHAKIFSHLWEIAVFFKDHQQKDSQFL